MYRQSIYQCIHSVYIKKYFTNMVQCNALVQCVVYPNCTLHFICSYTSAATQRTESYIRKYKENMVLHTQIQRKHVFTYAHTKRTCFYIRSYTCDKRKKKNIRKCIQCNIWKCVHWTIFVDVHTYVSPHELLHIRKGGQTYGNLYNGYMWNCVEWIYENEYYV